MANVDPNDKLALEYVKSYFSADYWAPITQVGDGATWGGCCGSRRNWPEQVPTDPYKAKSGANKDHYGFHLALGAVNPEKDHIPPVKIDTNVSGVTLDAHVEVIDITEYLGVQSKISILVQDSYATSFPDRRFASKT